MRQILWSVVVLVVVLNCRLISGQYDFDYTDAFENPLNFFWNNRNRQTQENRIVCNVNGMQWEGMCMNVAECKFSGGRSLGRGNCNYVNTCCAFIRTSNQTTDARVSYFRSPSSPPRNQAEHQMKVRLANRNICQIRVDIIRMTLNDPVAMVSGGGGGGGAARTTFVCNDEFLVEPVQTNVVIPQICGRQRDQHFYMHLNDQQVDSVRLTIRLSNAANPPVPNVEPEWLIRVSQLECPSRRRYFDISNTKENRNQLAQDFNYLAPAGCLQYFTNETGTVHSFGFVSDNENSLVTNQHYAICFRRRHNSCGVSIMNTYLMLRGINMMNDMCTEEMLSIPTTVPPGATAPDYQGTRFVRRCALDATTPANNIVISRHPGPLYVEFYSDRMGVSSANPMVSPAGFEFRYTNRESCP